jgi:hypothetical protein
VCGRRFGRGNPGEFFLEELPLVYGYLYKHLTSPTDIKFYVKTLSQYVLLFNTKVQRSFIVHLVYFTILKKFSLLHSATISAIKINLPNTLSIKSEFRLAISVFLSSTINKLC